MRLVVVIPTVGRRAQIPLLLDHLRSQERLPDEVVISAPDETHAQVDVAYPFPVAMAFGPRGSSVQRNTALEQTLKRFDIITFFDDDFVPADNYLRRIVEEFEAHPKYAVIMGRVVKDGANNEGVSWQDAVSTLNDCRKGKISEPNVEDHVGAYGCNMSIRSSAVGNLRFDERLALYGWQEDIDFTSQLRSRGRVVGISDILGVHLGVKAGRVSGTRFGYSQVVNPVYLIRKGTVPVTFALPQMLRNIAANIVRSVWPEPYIDRRGRLHGNLLGITHMAMGRIEPEYILKLDQ